MIFVRLYAEGVFLLRARLPIDGRLATGDGADR